jgi:hypothetical protein
VPISWVAALALPAVRDYDSTAPGRPAINAAKSMLLADHKEGGEMSNERRAMQSGWRVMALVILSCSLRRP